MSIAQACASRRRYPSGSRTRARARQKSAGGHGPWASSSRCAAAGSRLRAGRMSAARPGGPRWCPHSETKNAADRGVWGSELSRLVTYVVKRVGRALLQRDATLERPNLPLPDRDDAIGGVVDVIPFETDRLAGSRHPVLQSEPRTRSHIGERAGALAGACGLPPSGPALPAFLPQVRCRRRRQCARVADVEKVTSVAWSIACM